VPSSPTGLILRGYGGQPTRSASRRARGGKGAGESPQRHRVPPAAGASGPAPPGRGGGLGPDPLTMEEVEERREELAERAFSNYVQGDYGTSITCLEELLQGRSDGADGDSQLSDVLKLRIEHNLRLLNLLEPRGAGASLGEDALKSMQALLEQYKPSLAAKIFSVFDGTGPTNIYEARGEDITFDVDASRVLYNYALLLFSQKQYRSAQFILESIWTNIGLTSEATGIAVVCLLLDVLIHTARGAMTSARARSAFGSKTAPLLQFLSKTVSDEGGGGSGNANGNASPGTSPDPDESASRSAGVQAEIAFRMHLYKAKCALLQQNHRTSRKELKSALELYQRELREGHSKDLVNDASSGNRSELLAALLPLPRAEHANATALFLKANSEYLRSNYRKVLKLLDAASQGANEEQNSHPNPSASDRDSSTILTPTMRAMFLNNMGCLHLKMHRQRVALHYFQKALSELEATNPASNALDLEVFPNEDILYNTGLQLLLVGKPREAFVALRASATLFTHRPRLWIRLAECCIGIDAAQTVQEKQRLQADPNRAIIAYGDLVRKIVGKGHSRRVLLPVPETAEAGAAGQMAPDAEGNGLGSTLQDAVLYLSNAVYLAEDFDMQNGEEKTPGVNDNVEALSITVAAYTHLAYVYLRLGAPSLALDAAKRVLASPLPESSDKANVNDGDGDSEDSTDAQKGALARRYLAHTYAAEALCSLGRPDEALEHLTNRGGDTTSTASESLVKAAAQVSASAGLGVTGPWGLLSPEVLRSVGTQSSSQAGGPDNNTDAMQNSSAGTAGAVGLPSAADANAAAPSLAVPEKRVQSDAQVNLATVALLRGDLQQAQHHMELALQHDAYSPRARRTLVFLLLRYGHTERALRVLKGAVP